MSDDYKNRKKELAEARAKIDEEDRKLWLGHVKTARDDVIKYLADKWPGISLYDVWTSGMKKGHNRNQIGE